MNASEISDTVEHLQNEAQETAHDWKQTVTEWQGRAMESARSASQAADRYVHEHTWTSIGIAALAGCCVGFLLGGKSRH